MTRDEFKQRQAADLRDQRVALGLTQADVAAALHLAESTVSRWENGITSPGAYDARMLKRFLRDRAAAKGWTAEMLAEAVQQLREIAEMGSWL